MLRAADPGDTLSKGRRALVLGGTGAVGRCVVRELARRGVETFFGWHRAEQTAIDLAEESGARAVHLDLADAGGLRRSLRALPAPPDVLVHSAGVAQTAPWRELSDAQWDESHRVNCHGFLVAAQELAPAMCELGRGDVVVVGGLDRAQSLPVPVAWAAAQGMLSAMVMALGKEIGPRGVRVNMVALGPLTEGLSLALDPRLRSDYVQFSALRRLGTPEEAARAIAWLALENGYMNGKVLPVNGGI